MTDETAAAIAFNRQWGTPARGETCPECGRPRSANSSIGHDRPRPTECSPEGWALCIRENPSTANKRSER